jgi:hypothetical protein
MYPLSQRAYAEGRAREHVGMRIERTRTLEGLAHNREKIQESDAWWGISVAVLGVRSSSYDMIRTSEHFPPVFDSRTVPISRNIEET